MKTAIFTLAFVALCLTSAPLALAVEGTSNTLPTPEEKQRMIEAEKARLRESKNIPEKRAAEQAAKRGQIEQRTAKRSELLANECARVVENATALIAKIQNRIDRAKIEGRDVQVAIDALLRARTALASAQALCDQSSAAFDAIPTDTGTAAAATEARTLARRSREAFVQMRRELAAAISAIRGVGVGRAKPTPVADPVTTNQ